MKMVVMAILIEYYWSSPFWKVVEKNRLVSWGRYCCLGPRWPMPLATVEVGQEITRPYTRQHQLRTLGRGNDGS